LVDTEEQHMGHKFCFRL